MTVRYDVDVNGREGFVEIWIDHLPDPWPDLSYLSPSSKRGR